ncbi:MAG: acyl carrier protein [Symbiopectobacterium sp.]|uniref:acyl carrier protein n=1 Tax=Symbiopectobacterium sp. TaxID=2952789 RepID=UPI0039EB1A31
MNQQVEERINNVVSSIINCPPVDVQPEKHLYYDLLADSLMMIDLMLMLEQEFHINVKDEDLDNVNYVLDLYRLIDERCH